MTAETMLQTFDLTKEYLSTDPPTPVLNGVDLQVAAGEFLAVMGASGSGKSTLLYTISGMDRPTGGQVQLSGQDLTALTDAQASRLRLLTMGFVFQEAYFLRNLSIRDNILLPALKAAPRRKKEVLARVDALMERFGLAHLAGRAITEVSGGQLQRASICRALVCEPEIVFADEPTGSLNSQMTIEVMDALTEAHTEGRTLVMVTHDPACAARAQRVVYLRDGQLVDSRQLGTWTETEAGRRSGELLDWLQGLGF